MTSHENNFVEVVNAYKSYVSGQNVLNGLNLSVPSGKIYGLLGPSGCGKTTLLQCILNRISLDSGQVRVKNNDQLSSIAYMPQQISLYQELSVKENIIYFGVLNGLHDDVIEQKSNELLTFLLLSNEDALVQTLSGGQQRRVSFAISLLNDTANLLILDEPTVGVDPVLCASIWEYLLRLVSRENKTIIITTHYIEEARKAHTVGFMRHGQILAQNTPENLMKEYNSETLEDVFLALIETSTLDNPTAGQKRTSSQLESNDRSQNAVRVREKDTKISSRRIKAMIRRNYFWIKRNWTMILFVIILPIALCNLFFVVFGKSFPNLKLAIVNNEVPTCFSANVTHTCDFTKPLSCRFLKVLRDRKYNLVEHDNIESAKKSNPWGVIRFHRNFSQTLESRISRFIAGVQVNLSDIDVYRDASNYLMWAQITKDMFDGYAEFLMQVYRECGWPEKAANSTVQFNEAIYGENGINYTNEFLTGAMGILLYYFPMTFTMVSIMWERTDGKLERTLISGGNILEICLSQAIIQLVIITIDIIGTWITVISSQGVAFIGDKSLGILLLYSLTLLGIANGTLFATFLTAEYLATMMGFGMASSMFYTAGLFWPFEGMHWTMKIFKNFFPAILTINAFKGVALRGWNLEQPTIYVGLFSACAWIALFVFTVTFIAKRKNLVI